MTNSWQNNNSSNDRVLEYRRWDDYIKSLHAKLDDISNDMELMFYDPLTINKVCSKFLVLLSREKAYILKFKRLYAKVLTIYKGLHDKEYATYVKDLDQKTKLNTLYEKRKETALFDMLDIFQEINDSLSMNELNPKPIVSEEPWWKEEINDPKTTLDRKAELLTLRRAGLL